MSVLTSQDPDLRTKTIPKTKRGIKYSLNKGYKGYKPIVYTDICSVVRGGCGVEGCSSGEM